MSVFYIYFCLQAVLFNSCCQIAFLIRLFFHITTYLFVQQKSQYDEPVNVLHVVVYMPYVICIFQSYTCSITCNNVPMWRWHVTRAVVPGFLEPSERSMPASVPRGSPAVPTVGSVSPWIHQRQVWCLYGTKLILPVQIRKQCGVSLSECVCRAICFLDHCTDCTCSRHADNNRVCHSLQRRPVHVHKVEVIKNERDIIFPQSKWQFYQSHNVELLYSGRSVTCQPTKSTTQNLRIL